MSSRTSLTLRPRAWYAPLLLVPLLMSQPRRPLEAQKLIGKTVTTARIGSTTPTSRPPLATHDRRGAGAELNRRRSSDTRPADSTCTVRETSREPLVAAGRQLYIEPLTFISDKGSTLLAGTPNYVWRGAKSEGRYTEFGVIVSLDGHVSRIPPPIDPKLMNDMRAVRLKDGSWGIVFAESMVGERTKHEAPWVRLWYGVFDGQAWHSLERLPFPAKTPLQIGTMSQLVRNGDTLAFALGVLRPHNESEPIVFSRTNGRWSSRIIRMRHAEYVALANVGSLGWQLAVVRPDTTLESDSNSLFFYRLLSGKRDTVGRWQQATKVVSGGEEPVHWPSLAAAGPQRWVLSWLSNIRTRSGMRWEARAMLSRTDNGSAAVPIALHRPTDLLVLDSSVVAMASVVSPDGTPLWITDHVLNEANLERREMRFIRYSAGKASVIGRIPNPFKGSPSVVMPTRSEILIAGPLFTSDNGHDPIIQTLLIRARLVCYSGKR